MPTQPKPIVRLYEHVGTGVIIRWPSGVEYSNQVAGMACDQPSLEGVFVPLGNVSDGEGGYRSPELALRKYFLAPPHDGFGAQTGLTEADARFIEARLHENPLLRDITVDRSRLRDSCEAWVYVCIDRPVYEDPVSTLEGFGRFPLSGVLTWENSD